MYLQSRVTRGCSAARQAGERAIKALNVAEQVVSLDNLNVDVPTCAWNVLQPVQGFIQVGINTS